MGLRVELSDDFRFFLAFCFGGILILNNSAVLITWEYSTMILGIDFWWFFFLSIIIIFHWNSTFWRKWFDILIVERFVYLRLLRFIVTNLLRFGCFWIVHGLLVHFLSSMAFFWLFCLSDFSWNFKWRILKIFFILF